MMEDQRADARLGIHHHAFGQFHADFLGLEKREDRLLVVEIRARPDNQGYSACRDSAT